MIQHAITQNELVRLVLGLFSVLLVIMVLSWVVKRLQGAHLGASKGFQSVASMILGPKEKIMLLKVGTRYLLLGSGSGHITLLYDFGEELPPGFDAPNKPSFAELLKSAVVKS
ncbi:flagellar biosynthetic protein FliO [Legionella rowbothamii]|uniref:flagellar biosynthetic protein FliO n=1 Tax=Legionella rowbothamii TaxID=96229 RepID=UPI001A953CF5|nr:flagellar biosynthetic protein FliO [Legionella rowbothamii]